MNTNTNDFLLGPPETKAAKKSGLSRRNRLSETVAGQPLPLSPEPAPIWAGDWRLAIAQERVARAEERLARAQERLAKALGRI